MKKQILNSDQIMYALGNGNYSNLYFSNGTSELTSHTLKWYELGYPTLLRISKSAMINPLYVKEGVRLSPATAYITMHTGIQIPISRRMVKRVTLKLRSIKASLTSQ